MQTVSPHAMPMPALLFLMGGVLLLIALGSQSFKKRGLSPFVGEMLVGMAIGPFGFGWLQPNLIIHVLAELGLVFLLFETGLETQIASLWAAGQSSLKVALVGVLLPLLLATAFGLAFHLPLLSAILVGATLSATSIGITAKALQELKLQHRPETAIILGAAVIDDVLGLLILALLQGLFSSTAKGAGVAFTFASLTPLIYPVAVILTISILLYATGRNTGRPLQKRGLAFLKETGQWLTKKLIVPKDGSAKEVFILIGGMLCLLAGLNQSIGLSTALGGFLLGLALQTWRKSEPKLAPVVQEVSVVGSFMIPFAFVSLGMQLNWQQLIPVDSAVFSPTLLWVALGVTVIAFISKYVAGFAVPKTSGINRSLIGLGMIPRGEVGLIFVQVGLSVGALNDFWANVLVLAVCLSTIIPPVLLKLAVNAEEKEASS
jgi:Kef-type K+ transport system membrane component KefB